jgi:hypothetical protein
MSDANTPRTGEPGVIAEAQASLAYVVSLAQANAVVRGFVTGAGLRPAPEAAPVNLDATASEKKVKVLAALAALFAGGPNAAKIARQIGVKRTTLLSWPEFREAYDRLKRDAEARKGAYRGRRAGASDFESDED